MDKVKGMIFTEESVRAILAGTKTQTRRVIKPQPVPAKNVSIIISNHNGYCTYTQKQYVKCEYEIGDIVYAREKFGYLPIINSNPVITDFDNPKLYYAADDNPELAGINIKWRSPRHMPKAAARIFLRVTDVRVERLQQISEADAIAESVKPIPPFSINPYMRGFAEHWDKINGKRDKGAYKWECDPFVWVYTFERIKVE